MQGLIMIILHSIIMLFCLAAVLTGLFMMGYAILIGIYLMFLLCKMVWVFIKNVITKKHHENGHKRSGINE